MIIFKKFDYHTIVLYLKKIKISKMEPSLAKTEATQHINDDFLMTQCKQATEKMFNNGMSVDRIGYFIKDYQLKYIAMKTKEPELAGLFTFEAWYKWTQSKQNN